QHKSQEYEKTASDHSLSTKLAQPDIGMSASFIASLNLCLYRSLQGYPSLATSSLRTTEQKPFNEAGLGFRLSRDREQRGSGPCHCAGALGRHSPCSWESAR